MESTTQVNSAFHFSSKNVEAGRQERRKPSAPPKEEEEEEDSA